MNWQLLQDLMAANKHGDKHKGYRSNITLQFTYRDFESPELKKELLDSFDIFLKRESIDKNSVKVIQSNLARRRIVFTCMGNNNRRIVVKWIDDKAVGCFNFIGSIENEVFLHSNVATRVNSQLIPKYIEHGDDYIAVEMVHGEPLLKLIMDKNLAPLETAISSLLDELKIIYTGTEVGEFSAREFNKRLHSEYKYLISTRGNLGWEAPIASYCTPLAAQHLYYELNSRVYEIFASITGALPMHMTLRDLDEHNLLFDDASNKIYAVDMEDAGPGHFVFDIAYLSGRLLMGRDPIKISNIILPIIDDWMMILDQENGDSLVAMYRVLMTQQLIISAMNPWLWPATMTFKRDKDKSIRQRYKWLKSVWDIVDIQCKIILN